MMNFLFYLLIGGVSLFIIVKTIQSIFDSKKESKQDVKEYPESGDDLPVPRDYEK